MIDPVIRHLGGDKHCAIVYPVSWPERSEAHSTLFYIGELGVNVPADLEWWTEFIKIIQPVFPDFIQVEPLGYDQYGPDGKVRVLKLNPVTLNSYRYTIENLAEYYNVKSPSEWGYNPHISLKPEDGDFDGDIINLGRPELWWN